MLHTFESDSSRVDDNGDAVARQPVKHVAFSPNGAWCVVAAGSAAVVYDVRSNEQVFAHYGHAISAAAFEPASPSRSGTDSDGLLAIAEDTVVRIVDPQRGTHVRALGIRGHLQPIRDVAVSPDGRLVLTVSEDAGILWQAASGEMHAVLRGGVHVTTKLGCCVFAPDSRRCLVGSYTATAGAAAVYSTASGVALGVLKRGVGPMRVDACAWSTSDCVATATAAADSDGAIRLWDSLPAGDGPTDWSVEPSAVLMGPPGPVLSCAFDGAGARLVSCSGHNEVIIWGLTSQPRGGVPLLTLPFPTSPIHASFSDNGQHLLLSGGEGVAGQYDAGSGERIVAYQVPHMRLAFAGREEEALLTVATSADGVGVTVTVIDRATGRVRAAAPLPLPQGTSLTPLAMAARTDPQSGITRVAVGAEMGGKLLICRTVV